MTVSGPPGPISEAKAFLQGASTGADGLLLNKKQSTTESLEKQIFFADIFPAAPARYTHG